MKRSLTSSARSLTGTLLLIVFLSGCASSPAGAQGEDSAAPSSDWPHGGMVSVANPYAVEAAAKVLAAGGHAVDAAIAAHAVLGLVEPQSSGLGGGAFMLVYERASGKLTVFDGRETAPAGATTDMFLVDGEPMGFIDSWQSGVAIGVPGAVALYEKAHQTFGRRPWAEVLTPAIELATEGFEVSPRLNGLLTRIARYSELDERPDTAAYFFPDGEALPVGYVRTNPAYAKTLDQVVNGGARVFYTGALAEAIAAAAQAEPRAGTLSVADIEGYEVIVREALCGGWRDLSLCTAPPPSSGLAQIMIAGLYDRLAGDTEDPNARVRAFVDAQRLAYADRDYYVADPAFADVPVQAIIDPSYLDARATQRFAPDAKPVHGDPGSVVNGRAAAARWGVDTTREPSGTTHLSIIDVEGNAVSMTATVEAPFGSSRWVGGFLLNNQMTDFARQPLIDGKLAANAVKGGKRPRSSMSPIMIFDADGGLKLVSGSPGGNSIVAYVAKTTLGVLAWEQSVDDAIAFPNIVARGPKVRVETADDTGRRIAAMLAESGYDVQEREGENSGLHTILVGPDGLEGGADPRREGRVQTVR
ncbi:MAG: gamma-glutamyltransferase family protein [Pseudomonadota bacterium]